MNIHFGKATSVQLLSNGMAEAEDEKANVFSIPFVLPGERVNFECHSFRKYKKYFPRDIENPSPDRVQPICKHFEQCGGCLLQHMSSSLYSDFKKLLISNALIKNDLDPFVLQELTVIPFGKRRRANMDIVRKQETIFLGFHRYQSHQVIDVEECHTMAVEIVGLLPALKGALLKVMTPFQKGKVFFTLTSLGVDISLEIQGLSSLEKQARQILEDFALSHESVIARMVFKYRKTVDMLMQRARPVVTFDGVDVEVDAYSFLQATAESDLFMANFIRAHTPSYTKKILDLFCGRGTLTIPLSRIASVKGYECDKAALDALSKVTDCLPNPVELEVRDLFTMPLTSQELASFDMVVINPPRAGALAQVTELSSSRYAHTILYVSCNPETFARDAKILTSNGHYSLKLVHGLDQFAWSPHVEVLAVFEVLR